jgi:hypothetical protein
VAEIGRAESVHSWINIPFTAKKETLRWTPVISTPLLAAKHLSVSGSFVQPL